MACPACVGLPEGAAPQTAELENARMMLALPGIHCAACISGVERTLAKVPGVSKARVNLTLRRVALEADPSLEIADVIAALDRAGYEAMELDSSLLSHGDRDDYGRMLLMRLGVAGFAMMNVMLLSVAVWSGADAVTRDMMHWISAAIALPAVAFAGMPFYTSALAALRGRRLNMDVPITLAILLAAGTSLYETAHSGEHAYFDAAIALSFFLLMGRYLEHRTRSSARSAAQELAALEVQRAIRLMDGVEVTVPVGEIAVGDVVVVRPGANIPVDGDVLTGQSEVDRSFMTGETIPVLAQPGAALYAGEINLSGVLHVRATAVGANTELRRISDLVAIAEGGKSKYSTLADRAVQLYAPGVHILSVVAAAGWYVYTQDLRLALNIAAAVLIITCPCALGLAVPAVTTAVSGRLFRKGVLVKHETALERMAEVDTVVFDKTGTLTLGTPKSGDLASLTPEQKSVLFGLAKGSDHPLSAALSATLALQNVAPARVVDVTEHPGCGVEGLWNGTPVRLGRASWMGLVQGTGLSACFQVGQADPVRLAFDETLRPDAAACVAALRARGLDVRIMSGDGILAVQKVAARLGGVPFEAELTPTQKAEAIARLSAGGARVLMVGDGLNDTLALTNAHVSMSPASALNAARMASDFVLIDKGLGGLDGVFALSNQARSRIIENLGLASFYNVIAVPLAIMGMATPLIAALAMSASSLTVTLNAIRLKG